MRVLFPLYLAALALLILAVLCGAYSMGSAPVNATQIQNWFRHYSFGYVQRGLMGVIFQFFHGQPTTELIQRVLLNWEFNLLIIEIIFFWALLILPIFLRQFTPATRWCLLSFAAVILLAPVWRNTLFLSGFADMWFLLPVLAAFVAFIWKRPLLYFVFLIPAFLFHPSAFFFAATTGMLILHAVFRNPAYAARRLIWLAAAVAPAFLSLSLYLMTSPETTAAVLEPAWKEFNYGEDLKVALANQMINPGASELNRAYQSLWPASFFMGIAVFGMPTLLCGLLFATVMTKRMNYFTNQIPYAPPSFAAGAGRFLSRYDAHMMLAVGPFLWMPVITVSNDWSRYFYWSWWMLGLIVAYFIWTHGNNTAAAASSSPNCAAAKKPHHPQDTGALTQFRITVLMSVLAFTFAGAPLNIAHISAPNFFKCERVCVPPLTTNPLGRIYSDAVFNALLSALEQDTHGTGQTMASISPHTLWGGGSLTQKTLNVPADYTGTLFNPRLTMRRQVRFIFTLNYESDGTPPVNFYINAWEVPPAQQSAEQAIWKIDIPNTSVYHLNLRSAGGKAFSITDFAITFEN